MKWLNPGVWLAVLLAIAAAAGAGYWRGDLAGTKSVQTKWDAAKAKADREARAWEQKLSQDAANFAQEKQDEINRIDDQLRAANERLRNRPERPAELSAPGAACAGATGAELYREDGQFLNGEAARADKLRAALAQCYKQYESAAGEVK